MPMGKYKDFADCERRNQSKRDPAAYCGEIKARTEKALTPLAKAREILTQVDKLFGRKPTAPKGPVQNPQPQGIPPKVYQGKGFSGVAPAEKHPGVQHPGLARGAGRFQKHETEENPEHSHDPTGDGAAPDREKERMDARIKRWDALQKLPKYEVFAIYHRSSRVTGLSENEPKRDMIAAIVDAELPERKRLVPRRRRIAKHELEPVKKNGGGTDEATPELADVTMIGRTLQSVSEILSEHANEHHDLDKKKSRKPSIPRGPGKPGKKPHGQVKPRQQRGMAHGQRLAKHETEENPRHSHNPRKAESEADANRRLHTAIFDPKPDEHDGPAEYEPITKFGRTAREHRHHGVAHDHKGGTFVHSHEEKAQPIAKQLHGHSFAHPADPSTGYAQTYTHRAHSHGAGTDPHHHYNSSQHQSAQAAYHTATPHPKATEMSGMQKQHPDEYPQEWGPKHLYQKIAEEVEKIDKRLSLEPLKPKPPSASHRHVGKPRPDPDVPPAYRYTHEAPPSGTRAYETWRQTQKALGEIKKAVGGCPAGWHRHEPYDYCHPMKRAHRGETMMKPAGALEDAHGVLDEAVVQARALGVGGLERVLANFKEGLKDTRDPADAYKRLAGAAARIEQHAKDRIMAGKDDSPQERMQTKVVVDILRRAASKVKPKPEAGDQAHADVQRMDDKKLSRHYDALVDYLKGDQAKQLAPDVHQEYIDRLKAVNAELGRRETGKVKSKQPAPEAERLRTWDAKELVENYQKLARRVQEHEREGQRADPIFYARGKAIGAELKRRGLKLPKV